MGTFSKGILGGFSGKVGTVVGANWRGIDVMRSLPKKSQRVATLKQAMQRLKFAMVASFIRPIGGIIKLYFGQRADYKSRRNLAVSYHITEAIAGIYPNFTIDYLKVIISKGELLGPQAPAVTPQPNAELAFAWEDNSGQGMALADDGLVVVVYSENKDDFRYQFAAAPRSAMAYTMALPGSWIGDVVHCWITFASADDAKVANSLYMGQTTLL